MIYTCAKPDYPTLVRLGLLVLGLCALVYGSIRGGVLGGRQHSAMGLLEGGSDLPDRSQVRIYPTRRGGDGCALLAILKIRTGGGRAAAQSAAECWRPSRSLWDLVVAESATAIWQYQGASHVRDANRWFS